MVPGMTQSISHVARALSCTGTDSVPKVQLGDGRMNKVAMAGMFILPGMVLV